MGGLGKADMQGLAKLSGIKGAKVIPLLVAFELGRRTTSDGVLHVSGIHHPQGILEWASQQIGFEQQEYFLALFFNQRNQLISSCMTLVGTLINMSAHPREILWGAMQFGCARILCVHNHPSGDPQLSSVDTSLIGSAEEYGTITVILLMDHITVSRNAYLSLVQRGLLQPGPS